MNQSLMAAPMPMGGPPMPMGAPAGGGMPPGPGGMFPSIDTSASGPIAQLVGMVRGVQMQDTERLRMGQNLVLAALLQQMQAVDLPDNAGFAEGASGDLPPEEAPPTDPAMGMGAPPAPSPTAGPPMGVPPVGM